MADTRGNVTHADFVTHDTSIQAKLPQILLGNTLKFTLATMRSLQGVLPPNVFLRRQKSAWNSNATIRCILGQLSKSLGSVLQERTVVLVVDVASVHIHHTILAHAHRIGVRLLFVPASLTRVLQPLDTHVFSIYKQSLRRAWCEARAASATGDVSTRVWLQVVVKSEREVFQARRWKTAFQATWLLGNQSFLSKRVLQEMEAESLPLLPAGAPTLQELKAVFPKRCKANMLAYVQRPLSKVGVRRGLSASAASNAVPDRTTRRLILPATFNFAASPASSSSAGAISVPRVSPWKLRPK